MKKTKRMALYVIAALLAALFVLSCLVGFAACGGSSEDDCADGHTVTTWTWVDDIEANCGNDGTRTGVCDVCGETVTETVKATGNHTWDNGVVTTDPTETEKGVRTYTCTVCGATKTEDIDATGTTPGPEEPEEPVETATIVTTYDELVTAVAAGGSIKLGAAITATQTVTVSGSVSLDLNGYALTSSTTTVKVASTGSLTVTDTSTNASGSIKSTYSSATSTDNAAAIETDGTLAISSGTVDSTSIGIKAVGGSVTISGGKVSSSYFSIWESSSSVTVTISGGEVESDRGIVVCGDSAYGLGNAGNDDSGNDKEKNEQYYATGAVTTLNVTGGKVTGTKQSAISTYGLATPTSAVVNISGGEITGADIVDESSQTGTPFPAVYIPSGTLTISNGKITGSTAVEVKGGTASITGGELASNATKEAHAEANSSGASSYGYLLCVYPYTSTKRDSLANPADSISVSVAANVISDMTKVYVSSDVALVIASDGSFTVGKATSVESINALNAALETGGAISLSTDITGKISVAAGVSALIDLNGNTLSDQAEAIPTAAFQNTTNDTITVAEGAALTIVDSSADGSGSIKCSYTGATSTDNAAAIHSEGVVMIESGTISSTSIGIKAEAGSVTMSGGKVSSNYYSVWESKGVVTVTISGGEVESSKGIVVCGDSAFGIGNAGDKEDTRSGGQGTENDYATGAVTTLNVTDSAVVKGTEGSAISTYGLATPTSAVVNISGGTITGTSTPEYSDGNTTIKTTYPAVYIPSGTLTISGGTITGITAVEIRGGTATITGGTLTYSYTGTAGIIANSSGATSYGYQLCVNPYTSTKRASLGDPSATISVTVSATVITDMSTSVKIADSLTCTAYDENDQAITETASGTVSYYVIAKATSSGD